MGGNCSSTFRDVFIYFIYRDALGEVAVKMVRGTLRYVVFLTSVVQQSVNLNLRCFVRTAPGFYFVCLIRVITSVIIICQPHHMHLIHPDSDASVLWLAFKKKKLKQRCFCFG